MSYYQVDTQVKLADKLGISTTTLSNWKSRNTVDWVILFTKCEDVNLNWLIRGEGSMLRGEAVVKESEAVHVAPAGNIDLLDRIERLSKENGVLEARISELEREKKTQGTVYYGTAADKVMKYGQEEK